MKNIVFDFGGVVFHWRPTRLLQRELPQHATDEASAARWADAIFQGYGGDWGEFDRGTLEVPALVQRIVTRTGLVEADVLRVVMGVPVELQPQAATVDLIGRLRAAGHGLHFLSNMPRPFADIIEAREPVIQRFHSGVFSAREGVIKPEPAIYELAAARFKARPAELVFLDDHLPNVLAARALGWNALHFSDAATAEAAMREAGWMV
jgi:putative hydrolase of the HAD superfamily